MSQAIQLNIEVPDDLAHFQMPEGAEARLRRLLDRQESGEALSDAERAEAEWLVDLTELLSLLRMRAGRLGEP